MTPPVGVRAHNWGASRTERATGVHHPLVAGVLSIQDGAAWREVVTLDLCTWGGADAFHRLFEDVATRVGSDREHLLLHLVHTHAGPSMGSEGTDADGADLIGPYREQLAAAIAAAICRARATATDAVLTWAYGTCTMATNRDLPCADRDLVGFAPEEPADGTLLVGRISGADGAPLGVLLNYACHPTTLAFENSLLSADYVGAARAVVEAQTGVPCLFLQGASGDLAPRDQYRPGTELADRNGRSLGHAAVATLETMGTPGTRLTMRGAVESGAPLAIWDEEAYDVPDAARFDGRPVELACRPPMSEEEIRERWAGIDPVAAAERLARAQRLTAGYDVDGRAQHEVSVWVLGVAVLVSHAGEAYSELQTELRRRHPDRAIAVLNLTNGPVSMYLPTREAYRRNRYQVWQSRLEEGSLERLIDEVDARIRALTAEGEAQK